MKLLTQILAIAFAGVVSGTAHAEKPSETPPITQRPDVKLDRPRITKLLPAMRIPQGASGEAGRGAAVTPQLSVNGSPLAGKPIVLAVKGKNGTSTVPNGRIEVGRATTDASGAAVIKFKIPELVANTYDFEATFAGDDSTMPVTAQSVLTVVKSMTKIVADLEWPSHGSHYGSHGHAITMQPTLTIGLQRVHDGARLARPLKVSVNGRAYALANEAVYRIDLPSNETVWTVHAVYAGDGGTYNAVFDGVLNSKR